ncbi:hypothetical protein [Burkholderia ubonensis]|uniref:hypothetical protein n=1 Tax=Burkholderia ubonensis TaxID=101571 RepID=UPI000AF3466D|nr:hypothetical protein [Burkholderia ubonensis]
MRTLQVADRAPASRSPRPSADSFGKCRPIGAYDYPYIKKFKNHNFQTTKSSNISPTILIVKTTTLTR